ncbi:MAG: hypothetical protein OXI58_19275 [Gemmatimonadota bacterium]|nr:hypothetical protein [Gemmatimonadota bacterium]
MKNFRPITASLVLLLAFACSGLQVFCAPVAEAAPMPCHVANACGDVGLQAGCCCLRTESNSASLPFVPPAEQPSVSTPVVGIAATTPLPPRSAALRLLSNRIPQPHPPLFQLYCSFLI